MGLAIGADSIDWGEIAKKGTSSASKAARANPAGILITAILTPGNLGDSTIRVPEFDSVDISSISEKDKSKALEESKRIAKEMEQTCNSSNKECSKQQHNGRIQSQNGTSMIVTATEAGSVWTTPPLSLCKQYARSMRIAMRGVKGHSPNRKQNQKVDYEKGATVAFENLNKWLTSNTPGGVGVSKWSFSFDGTHKITRVTGDSRRIDIDIMKGEILKGL